MMRHQEMNSDSQRSVLKSKISQVVKEDMFSEALSYYLSNNDPPVLNY